MQVVRFGVKSGSAIPRAVNILIVRLIIVAVNILIVRFILGTIAFSLSPVRLLVALVELPVLS